MKNILLPTDFSENAKVAADFTVNLFCGLPMSLNLYHFYGLHHSTGSMLISIDDLLQKDAQDSMKIEVDRIVEFCGGEVDIRSKNLNGKLTDFISEIVKNNKIDMIAMGTQGSSGFKKDLFGSNTTQILNTVKAPVLVIPTNSHFERGSKPKIAFATDFKPFGGSEQMKAFMQLMKQKYGTFDREVVYISDTADAIEDHGRALCQDLMGEDLDSFIELIGKDIQQGLMTYLDEHKPDVLIMVHRKNSFFDRLLKTSLSAKMALKSGTPLMIFKD